MIANEIFQGLGYSQETSYYYGGIAGTLIPVAFIAIIWIVEYFSKPKPDAGNKLKNG